MGRPSVAFGGKAILLGGDMGQTLPVMPHCSQAQVVARSIVSWPLWASRRKFTLECNMRASEDPEYANWLSTVRDGSGNLLGTDSIRVPSDMLVYVPVAAGTGAKNAEDGDYRGEDAMIDQIITRVRIQYSTSQGICFIIT